MILKPIDNIDLFCEKVEPHMGVFASKLWLFVYEKNLKLIGIYKDEHQLIGGFYYLHTKKYGFTFLKLPPYTPHCGLFFLNESSNQSSILNFQKEVLEEVCQYISKQSSTLTILALPSTIVDTQPFIWNNYKVIPNYTYRIKLSQSIEQIKSQFDSKNRNAINKAVKEEVLVFENHLNNQQLFDFFSNSLNTAGANVYQAELQNIFMQFANSSNSFSLTAKKGEVVLGNVFCVYDKNSCYYLLGGVDKASGIQGVNNLLLLKSIEKAKALGCSLFDFEGSMLKRVERFFRSFGPEIYPYYTINKGKFWLELLLKLKKRAIF